MITEYIISDQDVGRTFAERDGFLLSLVQSRPPSGDAYARRWEERCFTLRDEMSPQNLFHLDVTTSRPPPLTIGGAYFHLNNAALRYFGALTLVNIPVGSEFEITLSDVYVQPRVSLYKTYYGGYSPNSMWGSNRTPRNPPLPLQRSAPPLQIASPVIEGVIERGG